MSIGGSIFKAVLHLLRTSSRMAHAIDQDCLRHIDLYPELYSGRDWRELDRVYTYLKRTLNANQYWRYGYSRIRVVSQEVFERLSQWTRIEGKTYCELGCGIYHPYGICTTMYLNGAKMALAWDLNAAPEQRAAEALHDQLSNCSVSPKDWNWADISDAEWNRRIQSFNITALASGELAAGVHGLPVRHVIADITEPPEGIVGTIDLLSSKLVLEHFMNMEVAAREMFNLMSSGGIAYHHIDLRDHRAYPGQNPDSSPYTYWTFLTEKSYFEKTSKFGGRSNRLRAHEYRRAFENVGFRVLEWDVQRGSLPQDLRPNLLETFSSMADSELAITDIYCVLCKP